MRRLGDNIIATMRCFSSVAKESTIGQRTRELRTVSGIRRRKRIRKSSYILPTISS